VGTLKVNVKCHEENDGEERSAVPLLSSEDKKDEPENEPEDKPVKKTQARFIMRANATHRVILNVPIFKEMRIGEPREMSEPPTGKTVMFIVPNADGKLLSYQIKVWIHSQDALCLTMWLISNMLTDF